MCLSRRNKFRRILRGKDWTAEGSAIALHTLGLALKEKKEEGEKKWNAGLKTAECDTVVVVAAKPLLPLSMQSPQSDHDVQYSWGRRMILVVLASGP